MPRTGGRLKARPRLHSRSRRAAAARAPTHAAAGRRAKPQAAPPSARALPASAQLPVPSALRSAGIFPRGWRVSTRSPRSSGSHLLVGQQPGAPTTRRPRRPLGGVGHGVEAPRDGCGYQGRIALGASAAATGAAGPPPSWWRQGWSANSQPWRGCARRSHTRPGRGRHSSEARPTRAEVCPQFLPTLPFPDLSNFSPLLGSRLWKAGIPARDVRQTPALPGGALSQFETP